MHQILTSALGNNTLSYSERQRLGSAGTLVISDPCQIHSINQIQLGNLVVFEEVDHHGRLQSCTGLSHTYLIIGENEYAGLSYHSSPYSSQGSPTIVFTDNHNHVLPYWLDLIVQYNNTLIDLKSYVPTESSVNIQSQSSEVFLVHIDQHSDLGLNNNSLYLSKISDPNYCREFAHHDCNIGNFITPMIEIGLITHMTQIRTEYALREYANQLSNEGINNTNKDHNLPTSSAQIFRNSITILDIDLDFRAPEMSITDRKTSMDQVRSMMDHADLITIATSPYFINQNLALELLHELVGPRLAKSEGNNTL